MFHSQNSTGDGHKTSRESNVIYMLTQAQRSGSDVIAGTLFLLKHLVQVDSGLEKLGRLSCKAKYASVVDTDPTLNMKTDIYNPALPVFISRVKKKKKNSKNQSLHDKRS